MKLLHINSYYHISKFYKNLYDNQVNNRIDITVFVPVSKEKYDENKNLRKYVINSINHRYRDRLTYFRKHNKIYKDLINKIDVNEFDMVHAHSLFSNGYIAYKLKKEFDKPYIVAVRNTDMNIFFKFNIHLRWLGIKILLNSNNVIFISEAYKKHCIEKYIPKKHKTVIKEKSIVIPNGINKFWLDNSKKPKKKNYIKGQDYIKLIYVGDISRNKNIKTTIKAIELLIKKGHLVEFKVIGRIKEKKYATILNKNFIEYFGFMSKEELIHHYRENDIFVMPSKHETFGIVYLESLSQCTPVIFTKNQGFDNKGNDGYLGLSVIYNDYNNIADSILKIINNYDFYSENCYDGIKKYSWDRIANEYLDIYNKNIQ